MTQEEKAKRYDEAIEIAKKELNACGSQDCDAAKQIFRLFPKLKESEDEKIRKEILEYFQQFENEELRGVNISDWLSWLEKQGEQRPVIVPKFMVGDFIKLKDSDETYEVSKIEIFDTDEIYYHLTNGGCVCENVDNFELVKQKPTDKVEPKFKVGDIIKATEDGEIFTIRKITKDKYIYTDDSFDWIKDQDEYELVEQKPTDEEMKELLHTEYEKGRADAIEEMQNHTWSEEDEAALGDALWCCKQAASIAKDENDMGNVWYAENWLKSLKDRVQPQPKQEWGEEDEKMIQDIINDIAIAQEQVYCKSRCEDEINWLKNKLKSLRPQSTWKPTEQQMKVLNEVINFAADHGTMRWNDYIYNVLKGLREQLKKLTE